MTTDLTNETNNFIYRFELFMIKKPIEPFIRVSSHCWCTHWRFSQGQRQFTDDMHIQTSLGEQAINVPSSGSQVWLAVAALTGFSITSCAVGNHWDMKPSLLLLWPTNSPAGSVTEPSSLGPPQVKASISSSETTSLQAGWYFHKPKLLCNSGLVG